MKVGFARSLDIFSSACSPCADKNEELHSFRSESNSNATKQFLDIFTNNLYYKVINILSGNP